MKPLLSLFMLSCIFLQLSSGNAIKVRRSSDNTEANAAFVGSGTVGASSLVSFTPEVTTGVSFGTTQTRTINSNASKTGTVTINVNKAGTITTSVNSLTVTGNICAYIFEQKIVLQ